MKVSKGQGVADYLLIVAAVLVIIVIAVYYVLSVLGESTYTLGLGETIEHEGRTYQLTEIIGENLCTISVDGIETTYGVGDVVGDLVVADITPPEVTLRTGVE